MFLGVVILRADVQPEIHRPAYPVKTPYRPLNRIFRVENNDF